MEKVRFDCWKDGKKRALTMSYDDGVFQDRRLVEIFNKYGIRGSFHLNSGLLDKESTVSTAEIATLYAGHEVSAHSLTHPFLERVSTAEVVHEILEDRRLLENACGYPVRGMSYPMGTYNDAVVQMLPTLGIRYARTVKATRKFEVPNDFLLWHPTAHHNDEQLFELLEKFKKSPYPMPLFYLWGHSYEFDRNDNWDRIEQFCEQVRHQHRNLRLRDGAARAGIFLGSQHGLQPHRHRRVGALQPRKREDPRGKTHPFGY